MAHELTSKSRVDEQSRVTAPPYDHHDPAWLHHGGIVSDQGGLNIQWTKGEVFCPIDLRHEEFVAQITDHALTDDAINYVYYDNTPTLKSKTTHPTRGTEVEIALLWCANGDIIAISQIHAIEASITHTLHGLGEIFPTIVVSGLQVSEEAGGANLDVTQSAGHYHTQIHAETDVAQIDSSVTNIRRWIKDGAGTDFTYDTNAEIQTTHYDLAGVLTAIPANKWVRSVFFTDGEFINWILPVEFFNNIADALNADDPPMPTGLLGLPKTTALIHKAGVAVLPAADSGQWIDVRPTSGATSGGVSFADLTGYVRGPASATDNYLAVYNGIDGKLIKDGNVKHVYFGDGAAAGQALHFVSGDTKFLMYNSSTGLFYFEAGVNVTGTITATTSLTTPIVYGGTGAAAPLTLQGSSHGSPANDYVDIKANGTQIMRIIGDSTPGASTHQVIVGAATPADASVDEMIVSCQGSQWCSLSVYHADNAAGNRASQFYMANARGTLAVPLVLQNGDTIGLVAFAGYDGATYRSRGQIRAEVDGAVSSNNVPTRIIFKTGTTSTVESFRIKSDQNILVAVDNELQFRNTFSYILSPASGLMRYYATTSHSFYLSNEEMLLGINSLTFRGSGQDPQIYWATANQGDLRISTTARFSWNLTGLSFNGVAPIARPNYTVTNPVVDRTFDAAAATLAELRNVVGTIITDLIAYGLYQ